MNTASIKSYGDTAEVWHGMIEDINNAADSIIYEQYIVKSFGDDEIGNLFMHSLIRAAKRGVSVSLLLDAQGCLGLFDEDILTEIRQSDIKVYFYKTLPWQRLVNPIRLLLRDHRKVLLVDHQVSWISGVVVGEEFRGWLDYAWRINDVNFAKVLENELKNQFERLELGKKILAPFAKIGQDIHLVGNSPGLGNRHIYEQICQNITLANSEVIMLTPYFVPPLRLYRVLKAKLEEGISIRLFTPIPSDHSLADWARWPYLLKLQKLGVEIYRIDKMNHAKIVIVDDYWATFGSANLDPLSLIFNHELNIDVSKHELVNLITNQVDEWQRNHYQKLTDQEVLDIKPRIWQLMIGFIMRPFV